MQVKIYADVVFIINLFMDCFLFWIVSKLLRTKTSLRRIFLGGLIAALLYCATLFLPQGKPLLHYFSSFVILSVSVIAAFRPESLKEFFKILLFAHIAAFTVGGLGMALFFFTRFGYVVGEGLSFSINHFSWKLLIAASSFIYLVIRFGFGWINVNILNRRSFCTIHITFGTNQCSTTALIDTGNFLEDPITKQPVIVVEFFAIEKFFTPKTRLQFYRQTTNQLENLILTMQSEPIGKRLRLIPFESLGAKNAMLLGFRADKVVIESGNIARACQAIIGISPTPLSTNEGYHALVNVQLLGNDKEAFQCLE